MESSQPNHHVKIYLSVFIVVIVALAYLAYKNLTITDVQMVDRLQTAENYFNVGDLNVSISELETLLNKNLDSENRVNVLVSLASAYAQKGSLEFKEAEYGQKALSALNEALSIDPNNSNTYRVVAYSYEIMQDYPNAIKNYQNAVALDLNNAMAYSGLGHAYDLMGDLVNAEKNLKEAVRINPELDHALLNLARVYYKTGKIAEADSLAQRVITVSKNNRFLSEAYNIRGANAFAVEDLESATKYFEQAIKSDETLGHNYVALAKTKTQALLQFGFSEEEINTIVKEALSLVEKAIATNPNLTIAYLEIGNISLMLDNRPDAISALNLAKEKAKTDISLSASEKVSITQFISDIISNNKL